MEEVIATVVIVVLDPVRCCRFAGRLWTSTGVDESVIPAVQKVKQWR